MTSTRQMDKPLWPHLAEHMLISIIAYSGDPIKQFVCSITISGDHSNFGQEGDGEGYECNFNKSSVVFDLACMLLLLARRCVPQNGMSVHSMKSIGEWSSHNESDQKLHSPFGMVKSMQINRERMSPTHWRTWKLIWAKWKGGRTKNGNQKVKPDQTIFCLSSHSGLWPGHPHTHRTGVIFA